MKLSILSVSYNMYGLLAMGSTDGRCVICKRETERGVDAVCVGSEIDLREAGDYGDFEIL